MDDKDLILDRCLKQYMFYVDVPSFRRDFAQLVIAVKMAMEDYATLKLESWRYLESMNPDPSAWAELFADYVKIKQTGETNEKKELLERIKELETALNSMTIKE